MNEFGNSTPSRRTFLKVAASSAGAAMAVPRFPSLRTETDYPDLARLRARHEKAELTSPGKT